jgi:hypothetical protein
VNESNEDFEREPAPEEGGGLDARDPARQAAGEAAEREGAPREGKEGTATGNPAAAGEDGD